jgi:exonuclease SbcC
MIIRSLCAENFLKYQRLELNSLPRRGIIAISGPNESGKSSIGETLCFALFGRTFSLSNAGLPKLIRWGAAHCAVTCVFESEGETYQLVRYLDTEGVHNAILSYKDSGEEVANGIEPVADALFDLLGFEYEEFIDSFYLAQREITKPHPHSYAVKSMAGIVVVEYVLAELEEEREHFQRSADEQQKRLQEIQVELAELEFDPSHLPQLEAALTDVSRGEAKAEALLADLQETAADHQAARPQIQRIKSARGWIQSIQLLLLALILAADGLWYLVSLKPDAAGLSAVLHALFAVWQPHANLFLYSAIGLALLFSLLQLRYWLAGRRLGRLWQQSQRLVGVLDAVGAYAHDRGVNELLEQVVEEDEALPRLNFRHDACSRLRSQVFEGSADLEQVMTGVTEFGDWLRHALRIQRREIGLMRQEIGEESSRQRTFTALRTKGDPLKARIAGQREQAELRVEAMELLKAAGQHMTKRFNSDLRDLAGHTLPLFTEGRYQHLQIDEHLHVRVFSSDKKDYMELEEISSGTQRQIMLAVRLALAQQVAGNAVMDRQYVFLDEPFAFFDEQRTRNSLKVLGSLSDDLCQIWVVAQDFPQDMRFDRRILCSRDNDVLLLNKA